MKNILLKYENLLFFIIILLFFVFSMLLPVYDNENGFHNIFFDNYKLIWYDGRSPLNFYLIKNIVQNNSISFEKGSVINNMLIENYFDLTEKNGKYYPRFSLFGNFIFSGILKFIPFETDIELFKSVMLLVLIFYSIILAFFYKIQRYLGLDIKHSLISTLIGGIATSVLIYSKYLFLGDIFSTLLLILLFYLIFKKWGMRTSTKIDILLIILLSIFLINSFSEMSIYMNFIFSMFFSYFILKNKLIKNSRIFLFIVLTIILFLFILNLFYFSNLGKTPYRIGISEIAMGGISIFKMYPTFTSAIDYVIFGYHDPTSAWKLNRFFSYLFYTFEQLPGNAIFLKFYGLFGALFSAKGFIYNSIFLIFSILGIFLYKNNEQKKLILSFIVLIIFLFGFMNIFWYGGYTPRYVRHFDVPILFLTFFSFYYIQEISKEKNKFKRYSIYFIFMVLVILSILNVASIAIRTDWNYEHEANLVSYDLVVWPWYPLKPTENIINLYLTELGESVEWKFSGEMGNCKSYGDIEGIITPTCGCKFSTYAERNINIPWEKIRVNVTACSKDGDIIGNFYFDDIEKKMFIQSNSCEEESILLENSTGKHNMILKPETYENCSNEIVIWKSIIIEKI